MSMAHIVPFRTDLARAEGDGEPMPRQTAEIVIFPGVRRERHTDPAPAEPRAGARAGPRRDFLALPD
jgi:hypothetical protein